MVRASPKRVTDRPDPELERWLTESPFGAEFALAMDAIRRLELEQDRMRRLAESEPPAAGSVASSVFREREGGLGPVSAVDSEQGSPRRGPDSGEHSTRVRALVRLRIVA